MKYLMYVAHMCEADWFHENHLIILERETWFHQCLDGVYRVDDYTERVTIPDESTNSPARVVNIDAYSDSSAEIIFVADVRHSVLPVDQDCSTVYIIPYQIVLLNIPMDHVVIMDERDQFGHVHDNAPYLRIIRYTAYG